MLQKLKDLASLGWPLLSYTAFNYAYDDFLYPIALYYWGMWVGSIVMVSGSLISCSILYWYYDRKKVDWLGAYKAREIENKPDKNWFERLVSRWDKSKTSKWGWMIYVLSHLRVDPLIVAVHYRESYFGGISRRDWGVLFLSIGIANTWWILRVGVLVSIFKWLVGKF